MPRAPAACRLLRNRNAPDAGSGPAAAPATPASLLGRSKPAFGKDFRFPVWDRPAAGTGRAWAHAMNAIQAPHAVRLPLDVSIVRRLEQRGLRLDPQPGEDSATAEARVETALMTLFRDERDEASFAALYDYSRGALLVWIAGLTGASQRGIDPLEVLQDAFVNIYRYAGGFRDQEARSFRVWSRTIVGNLVRRARHVPTVRSLQVLAERGPEPVDPHVSPADELVRGEDLRSIEEAWLIVLLQYAAAYERLSARDRLALDLVEVQGLSYGEACERLHVGLSNMKMILFRSRRRIRTWIARRLDESSEARRALAGAPALRRASA